jgi:hypothetical protein
LEVDDLSTVTIEDLARILEPSNPIERMAFRHGSSTSNVVLAKPFAFLSDTRVETFPQQEAIEEEDKKKPYCRVLAHELFGATWSRYHNSKNYEED